MYFSSIEIASNRQFCLHCRIRCTALYLSLLLAAHNNLFFWQDFALGYKMQVRCIYITIRICLGISKLYKRTCYCSFSGPPLPLRISSCFMLHLLCHSVQQRRKQFPVFFIFITAISAFEFNVPSSLSNGIRPKILIFFSKQNFSARIFSFQTFVKNHPKWLIK